MDLEVEKTEKRDGIHYFFSLQIVRMLDVSMIRLKCIHRMSMRMLKELSSERMIILIIILHIFHFVLRFCGMLLPPPIFSITNQLSIVFKSDRSVSGSGFFASSVFIHNKNLPRLKINKNTFRFETIDESFECDQTFTASSG